MPALISPDAAQTASDARLRLYEETWRLAGIGAWECDLATERLIWTEGVHRLFEFPTDVPLRRQATVDLYLDESRRDMERMRAEVIRSGQGFQLDAQIKTCRGEQRWMRLSVGVERENGAAIRLFGTKQDITADRNALDEMRSRAERDPLTGLANRALFDAVYSRVIGDTIHHGHVSALVLIDLDRFKSINDTLGHLAGDACLGEIAARLRRTFRGAALIARLGGDEFGVLLAAPLGPARIERMLAQAANALCQPFIWNGLRLDISCSIGAALIGRPHRRAISDLFAEADCALYAAKAAGRNNVQVFGDDRLCRPVTASRTRRAA